MKAPFIIKTSHKQKKEKGRRKTAILLGFLGIVITLSSCRPDEDHVPDPIHVRIGSPLRDFLFFKEGSYWIYKSNDGLYDTVTVTRYKVDTLTFVDNKQRLISTQEYFFFDYYSSYLNVSYTISRSSTSPYGSHIVVYLKRNLGGESVFLRNDLEIGKQYCGSSSVVCFTILEKYDTLVDGKIRNRWSVGYTHYAQLYSNKPVEIELTSGIGISKKITEFGNRTWELIDYFIIQ